MQSSERPSITSPTPQMRDHWAIVDDLPMFYRASVDSAPEGSTPIVHLHGFGISGRYLIPTAERLAHLHPTYVPDLPGYGRSRRPDHTLSIHELAHSLKSFLDTVGIQQAILLGNSMGCLVALEFAHVYPKRVERAILVSPAGGPHNQPMVRGLSQLARDSVREPIQLLPVASPDYVRFGPLNSLRLFRAMTRFPTVDRALELELPILIVAGTRDPLISHQNLTALVARKPNFTIIVVPDGAHALNFSHPSELASIFESWAAGEKLEEQPSSNLRVFPTEQPPSSEPRSPGTSTL